MKKVLSANAYQRDESCPSELKIKSKKRHLFVVMLCISVMCGLVSCEKESFTSLSGTRWESVVDENHYCKFYFKDTKNMSISLKSGLDGGTYDYEYLYTQSSGVIDLYLINPYYPTVGERYLDKKTAYLDKKKQTIKYGNTTLKYVK